MAEENTMSRRGVLRGFVGAGGAAGIAMIAAPGVSDAAPAAVPAGDTIMLIRHAEKPPGKGPPHGITADGIESAGSLTVAGWTRAGALVRLFAPAAGDPPAGLYRPGALWAADPRGDAGQRPLQTVAPLAALLGLTVDIRFDKFQVDVLAAALAETSGIALVSWQHEEIPAIVAAFGSVSPAPPRNWPDARYDLVWALTRTDAGWSFSQIPQLLLAGDRADIIL